MTDRVRKVSPVQPPAAVNRPVRAAPLPETPWANRQKWQEAERNLFGGAAPLAVQAGHERGGQQEGESDERQRDLRALAARTRGMPRETTPLPQAQGLAPAPPEILHLARMISAFASHATVQDNWAAQVPLSSRLLTDTVLELQCAQRVLTLRFRTTDWSSRHLVQQHSDALLTALREALPMMTDVYLSPD